MTLETINFIIVLLANGIRFYSIKHFICIFVRKEKCEWRHITVLYVAAWGLTSIIHYLFSSPALNICSNVAGLFLLLLPYRMSWIKKLLSVFVIYVVNALVEGIVILSFTKYAAGQPVNQIYECVTSLLLLFIAIVLERTTVSEKDTALPLLNMAALVTVPVISIGCMYCLFMTIHERKAAVVLTSATLLFINILIFYLYDSLLKFYSERIEKRVFEQMIEVYAYQLDIARESEERVRALRHDIKHHMIELLALARKDRNMDMVNYLHDMQKFMLNPAEHASTGNKEIDGVLNYLLQKADDTLEQVDIKINIPKQFCFNCFNVCVILGNLVDNAVREAGNSEEKYLSVNIRTKQEVLLIFIENSYSGAIIEKKNKIRTTQKDLAIYGIGLDNVKKIVAATGGDMKIEYSEHRFCVQVLLYLSRIRGERD